jgi:hypothetical protein
MSIPTYSKNGRLAPIVAFVAMTLAAQPALAEKKVLKCTSAPFELFSVTLDDYRDDGWFSGVSSVFFRDNYSLIGEKMVCAGHHVEDLACVGFVNSIPTAVAQIRIVRTNGKLFHVFTLLTAKPGEDYREKDHSWPCSLK